MILNPSIDDLHVFLIGDFYNQYRDWPGGPPDVSQNSFNWKWLRTFAAALAGGFANLNALVSDLFPNTAEGALLQEWATVKGLVPQGATGASAPTALLVYGTPTQVVEADQILTSSGGLRFQNTSSNVIGPGGSCLVDIEAIDVGTQTNLSSGEILTFTAPVAGINESAKLAVTLDNGTDVESDGGLQSRLALRFSSPPRGGAIADYVAWATNVTGIASAYCYPVRRGWGTTHVAALHGGSGTARILGAPEIASLQSTIDSLRPVGMRGFLVIETTSEPENVLYSMIPDGVPDHEFDWDDTTPPTVSAWDPTTFTVTFASIPPSLQPGDRIAFSSGATGAERVINTLGSPGSNTCTLTVDETGDVPTVSDTAYAGGPLVEPARQAILALINSLGSANPDANRYGTWEGSLDPGEIDSAARSVTGVLRGTVVQPSALVEATDSSYPDTYVGLITPGRILVVRSH